MAIEFAGFLYTTGGVAVNAATINLYDLNTTTPVRATTTTNSSGYWSISHGTDGQFDVEIVNGSTTRRIKYNNSIQMLRVEARTFRLDGSTSGRLIMTAAAATTDYTLTWPAAVGAASTYLQTNASGVLSWVANVAGVTREGGQTTEATTTSVTAVDLLTAASLTIAATEPFQFVHGARKSSGAAAAGATGLKLNTTVVGEAVIGANAATWLASTTDQAEDGVGWVVAAGRVTSYLKSAMGQGIAYISGGTNYGDNLAIARSAISANVPNATITDVVLRAISGNAAVTVGLDELQVYSMVAS